MSFGLVGNDLYPWAMYYPCGEELCTQADPSLSYDLGVHRGALLKSPFSRICSWDHSWLAAPWCLHLWVQFGAQRVHASLGLLPTQDWVAGELDPGRFSLVQDSSNEHLLSRDSLRHCPGWDFPGMLFSLWLLLPFLSFPGCQTCIVVWRLSCSLSSTGISLNKSLTNRISSLCSLIRGHKWTYDSDTTWC